MPARSRWAVCGSLISFSARSRSSASSGAQVSPSTPSRTASASAPAVVVITGTPCAKASRAFCEAVASRYGMTSASAAANSAGIPVAGT